MDRFWIVKSEDEAWIVNRKPVKENGRWIFPSKSLIIPAPAGYFHNVDCEDEPVLFVPEEKEAETGMKPFNLEEAKQGKPVCTACGDSARILATDLKSAYPIAAAVSEHGTEYIYVYTAKGRAEVRSDLDLMMVTEKQEGWTYIFRDKAGFAHTSDGIYIDRKTAEEDLHLLCEEKGLTPIGVIKMEWEE